MLEKKHVKADLEVLGIKQLMPILMQNGSKNLFI